MKQVFRVDGMHCGGCVNSVTRVLQALPGVAIEEVTAGQAKVRLDAAKATPEQVIQALGKAGFAARPE